MERNRPRGREKNISGQGNYVGRRGDGLGTGPVGSGSRPPQLGGNSGRSSGKPARSSGKSSPLRIFLLLLLLLGGGGLNALSGGGGNGEGPSGFSPSFPSNPSTILNSFAGNGSVSAGWQGSANTGKLDTTVASGARAKRTEILGNSRDTVTIMVYMCGTDLESQHGMGTSDLQEMLNAKIDSNVNLIIYTGGCNGWRNNVISSKVNQIYQIQNGRMTCLVQDAGSVSMTDPDTLSGFIRWCAKNFPANRNQLIFWDHGGGSISGFGYDEKFASSGSMDLPE